jgi:CHAT domain-containing protein
MSFLSRMMAFHRSYVDALIAAGRINDALEVADASRARVLAERAGVDAATRTAAASFVRHARNTNSVLLFYLLAPARSFVWTVTPAGIRFSELPAAGEIDRLAERHRTFIERSLGDPRRLRNAPGDALSAAVLEPVLRHVPSGSRVVIVPDGSLHGVNFETLPAGSDRRYWIEDATISVAPALSLVRRVRRVEGRPASVLVVGDPVDAPGSTLARLKYAAAEIDGIRGAFRDASVTVRRGPDASPAGFLSASPEKFAVVHFAAHATASTLSPLDSAIELSPADDGAFKLYARTIAQRQLAADLVTISACRSAGDRAYGGEGLVGLAWAFLRAGAARVIAGLWDVDDQSTATLMTDTYAGLAAGLSPAEALRAAKLRMLAAGGNFAKPYYWAPFQVFGE